MTFDRVQYNGRALILHLPLTLTPHLDQESGQLYVATDERLGVHVFARTREQLAEERASSSPRNSLSSCYFYGRPTP